MMHLFKNRTTRRRAGALDPIEPAPEFRPVDVAPAFELAARDLDESAKQALAFRFVGKDDPVGPSMALRAHFSPNEHGGVPMASLY